MISSILFNKYYPNCNRDGTIIFYNWLRSYTKPNFVVLNIGAGLTVGNKIRSLKGEVKKVTGIDIDKNVLHNTDLDEAYVITNNKYPFDDNMFDLAWSDYVFEHIDSPIIFLKEICRVIKPSASFFFRTPNKYHYVSILGRLAPHRLHELFSNKMRALPKQSHEPYKTYYLLNSKKEILDYTNHSNFSRIELRFVEAQPSYMMFNKYAFLLGVFYERIVNRYDRLQNIRANIFGRMEK